MKIKNFVFVFSLFVSLLFICLNFSVFRTYAVLNHNLQNDYRYIGEYGQEPPSALSLIWNGTKSIAEGCRVLAVNAFEKSKEFVENHYPDIDIAENLRYIWHYENP